MGVSAGLVKILVASTIVPFVRGGGTAIVFDLIRALRDRGHDVDDVLIPFHPSQDTITQQMLALRLLDLGHASDLLVAIRTPSYIVEHPNKVVWFIHHHRPSFDLWPTGWRDLPLDAEGLQQRIHLFDADNRNLRRARKLFTNSSVTADRLCRFNGLHAEVLYPPLGDESGFRCESFGDYVFCPSRLVHIKRQVLLVEAMANVQTDVRLVLAGAPRTPPDLERIERAIERCGVGDRVELLAGWISEERKRELFANALACAYIPFDEDSYGYVSLEAFHSRKPVITCNDSGGTLELVEDNVTGIVAEPDPGSLADAFDRLRHDPATARQMGEAGYERMQELHISWDHVVSRLTST
jgi:glycosyltransferase involved in cell wall biosynthesis